MRGWNWVLSADAEGRWITTQGYADVEFSDFGFHATLRYNAGDEGIYHWLDGTIDEDSIEVMARSPNPEVGAFHLGGTIFRGEPNAGINPMMILLTDGTTVLSLAHGPRSHEGNF